MSLSGRQRLFCGIDPGMKGGIAVIDEWLEVVELMPMPIEAGGLDYAELSAILHGYRERGFFLVEEVHAIKGASAKSTFQFGRAYEGILASLAIAECRHAIIKPREWQKLAWQGVKKILKPNRRVDTKQTSLKAVRQLFPKANIYPTERSRKPHDGMVDALLIAYAGALKYGAV